MRNPMVKVINIPVHIIGIIEVFTTPYVVIFSYPFYANPRGSCIQRIAALYLMFSTLHFMMFILT